MMKQLANCRCDVLGSARSILNSVCWRPKRRPANRMRVTLLGAACCWLALGQCQTVGAALVATAEITAQQISPTTYQYDITLNDTGTTNIATFWYAWVPGEGFLATRPTDITGPAGWTDVVTETYAIQWVTPPAGTSVLGPASSLSGFQFDSTDTPSEVFGLSAASRTTPVGTSFVYANGPLTDPGQEFVVQSTPEPSRW